MPMFDLDCPGCGALEEAYVPVGAAHLPPCAACGTPLTRRGVEAFSIRTPRPSGVTLKSGQFVKGTWGGAPRRVARRIKTFG